MSIRSIPLFCLLPVLLLTISSCSNYYDVLSRPKIDDGVRYGRLELPEPDMEPYYFKMREQPVKLPPLEAWADKKAIRKYDSPEAMFNATGTAAFLVIRNDTILYENYFNGYGPDVITQIFSVSKPLTASLLSVAMDEGLIESVDTRIEDYFDIDRRRKKCKKVTLNHLANMQSGFNHSDYWRLLRIVRFYHAVDVDAYIKKVKVFRDPGKKYRYKSIDTQVLGACLEEIFQEEDLLGQLTDLYWNNIGPEQPGYYSIDHRDSGNPRYYGGLNISARDLAKIGRIYMNDGSFDGKQVISPDWIEYLHDSTHHVGRWDYCMGWYFDENGEGRDIFYGAGFNGQYLIMNRTTNTIIVRLGETKAGHKWYHILSELTTLF